MDEKGSGSNITRWLFIGLAIFLVVYFGWPLVAGKSDAPTSQPLTTEDWGTIPSGERPAEETCALTGPRSTFVLSARGGAVKSARMVDLQYAESVDKPDTRIELVTPSKEQRMPLRTSLRVPGEGPQQVELDNLDFKLAEQTATSCTFVHKSDSAEVTKVVSLSERPFELDVKVTVTNRAAEAKKHRYAIEQTSWRSMRETESSFWDLGRRPEWLTDVITHTTEGTTRHLPTEFEPGDFVAEDGYTSEHFLRAKGTGVWAGISSNYFVASIGHRAASAGEPSAEALIEDGAYYQLPEGDPSFGHMYRARLAYPEKELASGESATYESVAYFGPKERAVLAAAGGADAAKLKLTEAIDLGMFGFLGKYLVLYVGWLFKLVGSWGWAICLLTITVKLALFPLSSADQDADRDASPQASDGRPHEKYKDDMMPSAASRCRSSGARTASARSLGCLPAAIADAGVDRALSGAPDAVELYHEPFLMPLIPDLSHRIRITSSRSSSARRASCSRR
jgi:YidC/Oxa1 family membrane protein insertase